jgi:exodeoxyribonuclease VII large subunit
LWGANKTLEFPWDFKGVLVVAPPDAAGLGDFRAEARRLDDAQVCRFVYAYSRFQGTGAAAEILGQTRSALIEWQSNRGSIPDALVFIRGGGAVNDLAWLNDFDLASFVCQLDIPVLTGIGHERDSTILDEVARTSFDTPSKVIGGIEATIVRRTREAQAAFEEVMTATRRQMYTVRRTIELSGSDVRANAARQLHVTRVTSGQAMADVQMLAVRGLGLAREHARDLVRTVQGQATTQFAVAEQRAPLLLAQIRDQARARLDAASALSQQALTTVLSHGRVAAGLERREVNSILEDLMRAARRCVTSAKTDAEALLREIAGQGPQKTLARGYAHVRDSGGKTVMSAAGLATNSEFSVTFHDGTIPAHVRNKESKP